MTSKLRSLLMVNMLLGWIAGALGAMAYHLVSSDVNVESERSSLNESVQVEPLAGLTGFSATPGAHGGEDSHEAPIYIDRNTISKVAITPDEERDLINQTKQLMGALRQRETAIFEQSEEEMHSHEFMVVIPGDAELASERKQSFFDGIREVLGERRARLYIASTRDTTQKLFGSYGGEEKRIRVSFAEEQIWFHEREGEKHRYFRSVNIPERFSHIFAIKGEGATANVVIRD